MGRHYVLTYIPLILLFSFGLVKLAEVIRHKYGVILALLLAFFIMAVPPLTILTAGEGWWGMYGNKLCMEKLRSNDAYLVKLVEPFAQNRYDALIVLRGSDVNLLGFEYPNATILWAGSIRDMSSYAAYNNIYFLKYFCDRKAVTFSDEGKPISMNSNMCNELESFSKEIILRTKDLDGNDIEIHKLEIPMSKNKPNERGS